MYVQNDLQTALLAAPAEYEALRKEYGQYTIISERVLKYYFNMDSDRKRVSP